MKIPAPIHLLLAISPPSGPLMSFLKGLHLKSNFLAIRKFTLTALWSLNLAISGLTAAETTPALMEADCALIQGSGAVFIVRDGMRHGIPSIEVFASHGFDGADVIRISDEQLQAIPEGPILAMATPEQIAKLADEFPKFIVPGQQVPLDRLRDLFRLHQGPKTTTTFETPYLLPSVLWPATGTQLSAAKLRQFYRAFLGERKIDTEGYVSTHQHRGQAHDDGWPFPSYVQAGGAGWLFSHAGDPFAGMFNLPLLTSLAGWESNAVTITAHDPNAGLQLALGNHASLTAPAMNVDSFVTPFIAFHWNGTLPPDAKPFLEWTTDTAPGFHEARRIEFRPQPAPPVYGADRRVTMIAAHRHPQWQGRITRLRVNFGNNAPSNITYRALHTAIDSRHPVNNPHWLEGCADYFDWTTDIEFLRENLARIRLATDYAVREFGLEKNGVAIVPWVGHDGRPGLTLNEDGTKNIVHGRGVGNNYWDLLPFGGQDAFLTITLFHALKRVADLEEQITRHPEWKLPAMPERVGALRGHVARLRSEGSNKFWDDTNGRFVGWIDSDGKAHDYGFTFLNLEAVRYGFANQEQAKAIVDWVSGRREVAGDTSTGADIYHWRFAPRATTRRNIGCYGWYWSSPESIPWGYQVQDGGAVLGFSFYDLMARLQVNGPDDAWQRLLQITEWFAETQAAGGYRPYYAADPKRGTLQGGGPPGGLGMDQEFYESVMVPQIMLYGFLGFTPQPDGFRVKPRLPTSWPSLTVTCIAVHDSVLDVMAGPKALEIKCRKASTKPLQVSLAPGQWQLVITDANSQSVGVATDHLVKTENDTFSLNLGIGQQAKFTRQ